MRIPRLLLLISGAACARVPAAPEPPRAPSIEIVETVPVEAGPNRADVPDTRDVWPEMIDAAARSIDLAQFYVSEAEPPHLASSKLTPVLAAIERAIDRKVKVRLLADGLFAEKYPAVLERLRARGADVRTIDAAKHYGGVMHAKYLVVDEADAFVGSQNFDWRSLAHTYEVGLRIGSPDHARELRHVFEIDWALAGGAERPPPPAAAAPDGGLRVVASPKGWLPREDRFELDEIVRMLGAARREIRVHVLNYSTRMRDGSTFTVLDDALRAAVARGVRVRLIVSDWSTKPGSHMRTSVESLASGGAEVRVVTIPKWSGGDIPYARVVHAKFLVVDEAEAWLGSSNWEGDYFLKSRDVGVVVRAPYGTPKTLAELFDAWWTSAYAGPIDAAPPAPAGRPSDSGPARP